MMKSFLFFGAILSAIAFWSVVFFRSTSSQPPTFPGLAYDPSATKTLRENSGIYYLEYAKGEDRAKIFVGDSKVKLKEFVNMKVQIEAKYPKDQSQIGDYVRTTQCVAGECRPIFDNKDSSTTVIDIESIKAI